MTQEGNGSVRVEGHGPVAELVLDRPAALNALSAAFAERIADEVGRLSADPSVRAVVVSSSSARAFCVGADLKERNRLDDEGLRAQRAVMRRAFAHRALRRGARRGRSGHPAGRRSEHRGHRPYRRHTPA